MLIPQVRTWLLPCTYFWSVIHYEVWREILIALFVIIYNWTCSLGWSELPSPKSACLFTEESLWPEVLYSVRCRAILGMGVEENLSPFRIWASFLCLISSPSTGWGSWDCVVGVVTRLQAGWPVVWIPAGVRDFSVLRTIHVDSGAYHASYSASIRVLSWGQSNWSMTLTTHLDLVPRLRMTVVVPLLHLFAYMSRAGGQFVLVDMLQCMCVCSK